MIIVSWEIDWMEVYRWLVWSCFSSLFKFDISVHCHDHQSFLMLWSIFQWFRVHLLVVHLVRASWILESCWPPGARVSIGWLDPQLGQIYDFSTQKLHGRRLHLSQPCKPMTSFDTPPVEWYLNERGKMSMTFKFGTINVRDKPGCAFHWGRPASSPLGFFYLFKN